MPNEINNTFIALIPKIDNPLTVNNYMPISLCNTILKIITKILANRLKPLVTKIIHPLQGAFVKNRAIHDNILVADEIFHSFHDKKERPVGWPLSLIWKKLMTC